MNIHFNAQSIQKACDLISGDMNLFLSHQQMVELLSTNPSLFEAVNDGGLSGLFCPEKNNPILIDYNDPENYSLGRAPDVVSFSSIIPVIQKHVFNHLSMSLLSIAMPTVDEFDAMNETVFAAFFFQKLQAAGIERGYKYSTHPDGPDGDAE